MDIKTKVVDLSFLLHLEATGDSEAGYSDPAISSGVNHAQDDDNEDAESCSCDTTSDLHMVIEHNYSLDGGNASVEDDEDNDGEVVDKKCIYDPCINGMEAAESKKSSAVSIDSSQTMNEMEKNRLFWETCLAS
ncbi:hypothetical protein F3Y22_tig00111582pilonHSYRG00969 [Hibiscus syriacus]|uniref:Uncharacterized protein n=1 Tax=Hibiscus syriacus TaxID=106335 RepID=A0A6A2Y0T0_HIBSY|nr:uncharacterized protein LOC120165426 [Hibiscus syriacus]KAE8676750.1 hypothetical protein F3Y22_tig00111582pilonHSYRG00969 [Hibiscus syriacus]